MSSIYCFGVLRCVSGIYVAIAGPFTSHTLAKDTPMIWFTILCSKFVENKTKVICANSKFELRNVTVGEVA